MSVEPDLVTRLEQAAVAVIQNQRPALGHDVGSLRSVTIEIEIGRRGELGDAECYISRRVSTSSLLGTKG